MADFVMTIDSGDEEAEAVVPVKQQQAKSKKAAKQQKKGKGKQQQQQQQQQKGKKRSREQVSDDDEESELESDSDDGGRGPALDKSFHFDGLGGGFVSSNGKHAQDAWDLTAANFKARPNALPRPTVDEIIARRRAEQALAAAEDSVGSDDEEDVASDEDVEALDEELASDDDEELLAEDDDELLAGEDGLEDDLDGGFEGIDDISEDDEEASDVEQSKVAETAANNGSGKGSAPEDANDKEEETKADEDWLGSESEDAEPEAPTGFAALADVSDEEEEEEGSEHEEEKEADDNDPSYFTAHKVSRARQQHTFGTMPNCKISRPIMLGLNSLGLEQPTRIQTECIPVAMAGLDIVASSQTGSGKTVAFWVGILERLQHRNRKQANTRVVVLTPTRELAVQVHSVGVALARYTDISFCLCVGGLSLKAQEQELKRRPDVVVSTPGRLIDHVRNTPCFTMDSVEILVLDEADRMLEEGFHDELEEIIQSAPHSRQTLLFSATVTESISKLSRLSMNKPVRIKVDDMTKVAEGLTQEFVRVRGDQPGESIERNSRSGERNREALLVTLCATTFARKGRTIIFFRSKAQAHRMKVVFSLYERGLERSDELHGDLTQEMRLQSLKRFRDGESAFLMATDLASRGLDIKGIETVINYEMPRSIEIYMHRVGRTARAGARGRAITLVGETDRKLVKLAVKHASAASKKKGTKRNEVEQRVVGPSETKETSAKLKALEREVRGVFEAEREEKELRRTEMELQKGENLLLHEEEIKSRPARSWFQSGADKAAAKQAGKVEHNAKFLEKEKKAAAAQKAARKPVNRKERRKREMAEADAEDTGKGSSKGAMAASIRSAKKAARPTKITHMSERSDKPKANSGKRKKNKSSFGSEMGVSGGGAQSTGAPSPKKRKVEHKKGGKPNKRR